ncbi:MAG TPA: hypothetical protein VF767_07505 [Bryobacteraceae bacterium]
MRLAFDFMAAGADAFPLRAPFPAPGKPASPPGTGWKMRRAIELAPASAATLADAAGPGI